MSQPFSRVLIANRGEIACRIIKTLRQHAMTAIVLSSDVDINAKHVREADEVIILPGKTVQETYLNIDSIIKLAVKHGIDAIHPGYGFLSESAIFARACEAADITYIGPPAEAIAAMGNKITAKEIADELNIPTLSTMRLTDQISYADCVSTLGPLFLIKAAAGGGGKGMRIVRCEDEFSNLIEEAKRESKNAFDDDTLFAETYLESARHVEIQILADHHGNVIHLLDRECSLQRRYQKVIEEAPALVDNDIRQKLFEHACQLAKHINYCSLGTVEFLVDQNSQFYFMEMNTRLQVEHPVTEAITGLDCVNLQLIVAQNNPIPLQQQDINAHGHAIEARICAENPQRNFMPDSGTIHTMITPPESAQCRIDSGYESGDMFPMYYDSLIMKIINHSTNRVDCIKGLKKRLAQTFITGIASNLQFLQNCLIHRKFVANEHHIKLIDEQNDTLVSPRNSGKKMMILALILQYEPPIRMNNAHNAWQKKDSWRLQSSLPITLTTYLNNNPMTGTISKNNGEYHVELENTRYQCQLKHIKDHAFTLLVNQKQTDCEITIVNDHVFAACHDEQAVIRFRVEPKKTNTDTEDELTIKAPMPGTITSIACKAGDQVKENSVIMTMEAMKMEYQITSPADATVTVVHPTLGQTVHDADVLIELSTVE